MIKVNFKVLLLTGIMVAALYSCDGIFSGNKDERLARVFNKYLYKSDISDLIAPGTSTTDSIEIVKRYIDNWIRQQIYLRNAEKNLASTTVDIQRKVDNYRNSLIVFAFENSLVEANLDTIVSMEILADYYDRHKNEFTLRDNIVKLNYIKVPLNAPDLNVVRRLIVSDKEDDIVQLEEYALNNAAGYFLDQEAWFIFTDILRDIPINPSNHQSFLRNNKYLELNDQYYRYFIFIRDYILEGSPSPLAFQSETIKSIILNHRKQAFINEYRQNAFRDAARNQDFEIY